MSGCLSKLSYQYCSWLIPPSTSVCVLVTLWQSFTSVALFTLRSPRKGLMSPKNLIANGSFQVFGFDPPTSSITGHTMVVDTPQAANGTLLIDHNMVATSQASLFSNSQVQEVISSEKSKHSVSPAISAKSFHTNRKISPPLNRPGHLRFT